MPTKSPKDSSKKTTKERRGPGRPSTGIDMISRTYYLPKGLSEKIVAYAYWQRMSVSAALTVALQEFFDGKRVKPVPRGGRVEVSEVYKGGK